MLTRGACVSVGQELLGRAGKKREGECIITGMVDLSSVPEPECNTMVGQVPPPYSLISKSVIAGFQDSISCLHFPKYRDMLSRAAR